MKKDITYDEVLAKIQNKYILAIVAGKRARQLENGEECLVKALKKDTNIKKALREIMTNKIGYEIQKESGE